MQGKSISVNVVVNPGYSGKTVTLSAPNSPFLVSFTPYLVNPGYYSVMTITPPYEAAIGTNTITINGKYDTYHCYGAGNELPPKTCDGQGILTQTMSLNVPYTLTVTKAQCTIAGQGTFSQGECNHNNKCQYCDPVKNYIDWWPVPSGKVCYNNSLVDVYGDIGNYCNYVSQNNNYYCNYVEDCEPGKCSATQRYTSCDGLGSCRPAIDHTDSCLKRVYADRERVFDENCGSVDATSSACCNELNAPNKCENAINNCKDDPCLGGKKYPECDGPPPDGTGKCSYDPTKPIVSDNPKYFEGATILARRGYILNSETCAEIKGLCGTEKIATPGVGDDMYGAPVDPKAVCPAQCYGTCDYILTDKDGNHCDYARPEDCTLPDSTLPTVTIISPPPGSDSIAPFESADFDTTFNIEDNADGKKLSSCEYKVESAGVTTVVWTIIDTCFNKYSWLGGSQKITVNKIDESGNLIVSDGNCQNEGENKCKISIRATDQCGNSTEKSRFASIDWSGGGTETAYRTNIEAGPTPPIPTGVSCQAISSSQIDVSWNSVSEATNYEVYEIYTCLFGNINLCLSRRLLAIVGSTQTSWSNTGLSPETTYRYRVKAVNLAGPSDFSERISATTPPPTYCGDNLCNGGETCSTCSQDCGECPLW